MENNQQKTSPMSSAPGTQHPEQFNQAEMNPTAASETVLSTDSSIESTSPTLTHLSSQEIDHLIKNCDLKSEDITSLMAEKASSSDSEYNYGSFTPFSKNTPGNSTSKLTGKAYLDEGTLKSWSADGSDSSDLGSCREPLIPMDDESDMEEFDEMKENIESAKADIDKEGPFVKDLINLKESQEKILEPTSYQAATINKSLIDIVIEPVSTQTSAANKSPLCIEIEPVSTKVDAINKGLLDIKIKPVSTQVDATNKGLLDIKMETVSTQTDATNKSLQDIENEPVSTQTATANKSRLDIEIEPVSTQVDATNNGVDIKIEPVSTQVDATNKSLLDIKMQTVSTQTDATNKSLLDIENEPVSTQTAATNKSLLDIDNEPASTPTAATNKRLLDIEIEPASTQVDVTNKGLLDIKIEPVSTQVDVTNRSRSDIQMEPVSAQTYATNKSLQGTQMAETASERKEVYLDTESCARVCIEDIKNILNKAFHEEHKPLANQTIPCTDAVGGNRLKTLDNELTEEAETNAFKRTLARSLAELGLPKIYISDAERVIKDKTPLKDIKKIGVYYADIQTSFKEPTYDSDGIKKEVNAVLQPLKTNEVVDEELNRTVSNNFIDVDTNEEALHKVDSKDFIDVDLIEKTLHKTDSNEFIDVTTVEDSTINIMKEPITNDKIHGSIEKKDSTKENVSSESLKEHNSLKETMEDVSSNKFAEDKTEIDDSVKEQKSAMIKSILKNYKHVNFADQKVDPGMEHMHHEESPKIEERELDISTPLRFLTETYPSHEDEELLSESLTATLEPSALSRRRRGSPRASEILEELKILEGEEQLKTVSVSPCQSPDKTECPDSTNNDDGTATNKSGNKLSKFFKSVKKKIFS